MAIRSCPCRRQGMCSTTCSCEAILPRGLPTHDYRGQSPVGNSSASRRRNNRSPHHQSRWVPHRQDGSPRPPYCARRSCRPSRSPPAFPTRLLLGPLKEHVDSVSIGAGCEAGILLPASIYVGEVFIQLFTLPDGYYDEQLV